jgi:hypothetical protein
VVKNIFQCVFFFKLFFNKFQDKMLFFNIYGMKIWLEIRFMVVVQWFIFSLFLERYLKKLMKARNR